MPTVQKTPIGARFELDALVAQVNALITDLAALRTSMGVGDNLVIGRDDLTATVADLGVLRTPIVAGLVDAQAILTRYENGTVANPALADGTTDGKIQNVSAIDYRIKGAIYTKAATDDLWNLTAEIDTDGTHYRAYWLYLDANGTASFAAGADALTSEAIAIAALPAVDVTKSVIGVYVAGPTTDFNGAAGLDSFGTFYNGWPSTYARTAASPAAITTSTTLGIGNGTTAGRLRTNADIEYAIGSTIYRKAATDNLWNLSAETDTTGAQYRAYRLYLDSAGGATAAPSANAASAAAALAALPANVATKVTVGIYVAGPSTDFDNAGGLAAQGTIYEGQTSTVTDLASATAEAITLVGP